ncbi:MAG: hypothetical protein ACRCT2_08780, partial [Plesiomonas shigelloides]
ALPDRERAVLSRVIHRPTVNKMIEDVIHHCKQFKQTAREQEQQPNHMEKKMLLRLLFLVSACWFCIIVVGKARNNSGLCQKTPLEGSLLKVQLGKWYR